VVGVAPPILTAGVLGIEQQVHGGGRARAEAPLLIGVQQADLGYQR
jgi:hypothetical protein